MPVGVLTQDELLDLVDKKIVIAGKYFESDHVGPASIDLSAEDEIYQVDFVVQPNEKQNEKVRDLLPLMMASKIKRDSVLKAGKTYLAKASVELDFSNGIIAMCNTKSSNGRNFIFCRVIADGIHAFDYIYKKDSDYKGELWIMIMPLVFDIELSKTERLVQMRIATGNKRLDYKKISKYLVSHDLLFRRTGVAYPKTSIAVDHGDGSVLCTLHLKPGKIIGYECIGGKVNLADRGLDPKKYFKPLYVEDGMLKLEAGKYYLLATNEAIKVPVNMSCELLALDTRLGLFFSHFAGFFDPGFFGTGTLEIMSPYDVVLRDKQPVAKFVFDFLTKKTIGYGQAKKVGQFGNYQGQMEVKLPKQFCEWD